NGAAGVAGISLAVRSMEGALDLYQRQLGLTLDHQDEAPQLAARQATFKVGALTIALLAPVAAGPIQQTLDAVGEGVFELTLTSKSLDQTRAALVQAGLSAEEGSAAGLLLPIGPALGARLRLQAPTGS